jgi:hypothetical protein
VAWALPILVVLTAATPAVPHGPVRPLAVAGVTPPAVSQLLPPGTSSALTATVQTPTVPARPDVILLVDGTGSMADAIGDVQDNLLAVVRDVPNARFAVGTYRDITDEGRLGVFDMLQQLTDRPDLVQGGLNALNADGGFSSPGPAEDWINALFQIGQGAAGDFRPSASRIVVLVGDASSHDPSNGHSLADAIAALKALNIRVVAVGLQTAIGDGLNGTGFKDNPNNPNDQPAEPLHDPGEADRLVSETNGVLVNGIDSAATVEAITQGLTNLPATVTHQGAVCDPGLSVTLDPPTRQVTSGLTADFHESIAVAPDAPQGKTLTCAVQFAVTDLPEDGSDPPEEGTLRQTVSVQVRDVTRPVITLDDRTVRATDPGGVAVDYTATAVDAVDGPLELSCDPPPGSLFPVGATLITCTASDQAGNVATKTATLTVQAPPPLPSADLRVLSVQPAPSPGFTGGPVTVTTTVSNAGPDAAHDVVLAVALPPGAQPLDPQSGCTTIAPCTIPAGTRRTVTIRVSYPSATAGTIRAAASGLPADLFPANNSATARLSVIAPQLTITPTVGRPGLVVQARGVGFPPRSTVQLTWQPGITAAHVPVVVGADGTFASQVLILRKDQRGPRVLRATGPGYAPVEMPFLVTQRVLPGQSPDLGVSP